MIAAIAPFAVLALCATPWAVLVGRRFGHVLAAISVLVGTAVVVLLSFHASRMVGTDPVWVSLGAAGVIGAAGLVLTVRGRGVPSVPSRAAVVTWVPAAAGLMAWMTTLAVSPLVSGSIRGWAMNGDAGNNIRITREMLDNHGHLLTVVSAVPLQNELLAIATWAGRGGSTSEQLAHDIYALAVFGALAIGLTGMFIGVVATSLLPTTRVWRIGVIGALSSLACTTWFVSGLPIESGYLNVHVVLPFALATVLAFRHSRRHPVFSGILLVALTLVIATSWVPLAVVPAGFIVALVLRYRTSPRFPRGAAPLAVVAAVVVVFAVAVISHVNEILLLASQLAAPGLGFPGTGAPLAIGIIGTIALGEFARRRGLVDVREGVISLAVSSLVGLGVLLAICADSDPPWLAYYPAKYSWLVVVLTLALLLAIVLRLLDGLPRRRATAASIITVVLSLVAATLGPAPIRENFRLEQPLARILTDSVWTEGERSVDTIIEYNGSPEIVMQWGTGSPDEAFINFWSLEFKGSGPKAGNDGVRYFTLSSFRQLRDTGTYSTPGVDSLCPVVETLGGAAVIHTRDSGLAAELHDTCPELDFTVLLDLPPADTP